MPEQPVAGPTSANSPRHSFLPVKPPPVAGKPPPEDCPPVRTFSELPLPAGLLQAIDELGFTECTPIQGKILPCTLKGHDAIGQAQTGTGKTAAFLITLIERLMRVEPDPDRPLGKPRALVLAPTRELALQILRDLEGLLTHLPLNGMAFIGGEPQEKQQTLLERHAVDILVSTPGRLLDFLSQRLVNLRAVHGLVLDEADRMLDMGFIPQVRRIIAATPADKRQTMLFSATLNRPVVRLAGRWMRDPVLAEVSPERLAAEAVDQQVYAIATAEKLPLLRWLLNQASASSVLVFVNRRDTARRLHEKLAKAGVKCGLLTGEVKQNKRISTLEAFRKGTLQAVVATDVAGRGLHVDDISHVVNYNLPEEPEDYVHRIGRTGRAGAYGTSVSFACEEEAVKLPPIEKLLGYSLRCIMPPEGALPDY